jgi:hypothetical protein
MTAALLTIDALDVRIPVGTWTIDPHTVPLASQSALHSDSSGPPADGRFPALSALQVK